MTPRWTMALMSVGLCLLNGCTILQSNGQPEQPVADSPASSPSSSPSTQASTRPSSESSSVSNRPTDRPNTRVTPMTIEGTVIEMELVVG